MFIMRWNLDEIRRLKIKQKFYIMLTRELTQSQNYVKKQKIVIEQLHEFLNSMKQWEQMQFINASLYIILDNAAYQHCRKVRDKAEK